MFESLDSAKIFFESLDSAKIFFESLDSAKIFFESLDSAKIFFESLDSAKIFFERSREGYFGLARDKLCREGKNFASLEEYTFYLNTSSILANTFASTSLSLPCMTQPEALTCPPPLKWEAILFTSTATPFERKLTFILPGSFKSSLNRTATFTFSMDLA